jgi:hypothetical protein
LIDMTHTIIYFFGFLACFFGLFLSIREKSIWKIVFYSFMIGANMMIVYHNYNITQERDKNNEMIKNYQLFREEFERNLENERF